MPSDVFVEQKLFCGRLAKYEFSIYDLETELPVAIGGSDEILAKLALQLGDVPTLDLTSASGGELDGGSKVVITSRGSVGNADPAHDTPATGYVLCAQQDTAGIPSADGWTTSMKSRRYWLELILKVYASGNLDVFGRGLVMVFRSPGGNT